MGTYCVSPCQASGALFTLNVFSGLPWRAVSNHVPAEWMSTWMIYTILSYDDFVVHSKKVNFWVPEWRWCFQHAVWFVSGCLLSHSAGYAALDARHVVSCSCAVAIPFLVLPRTTSWCAGHTYSIGCGVACAGPGQVEAWSASGNTWFAFHTSECA